MSIIVTMICTYLFELVTLASSIYYAIRYFLNLKTTSGQVSVSPINPRQTMSGEVKHREPTIGIQLKIIDESD